MIGILCCAQQQQCQAFVSTASSMFGARLAAAPQTTSRTKLGEAPRNNLSMVLTGLSTPKKNNDGKKTWDDDFQTTVGKAAFSSLKDKARDMMVKGAEKRGLDWTGIVETLKVSGMSRVGTERHGVGGCACCRAVLGRWGSFFANGALISSICNIAVCPRGSMFLRFRESWTR